MFSINEQRIEMEGLKSNISFHKLYYIQVFLIIYIQVFIDKRNVNFYPIKTDLISRFFYVFSYLNLKKEIKT